MIEKLYQVYLNNTTIVTDSRKCLPNSIFFALHGANFNGNKFAKIALENGCNYAVIDDESFATDKRYIVVKDTLKTLQDLATFHRKQLNTPLLAITGTNGKTTSKELIAAVLKQKYSILYTEGNYNNHIGVPLTLLRLKAEHELGIIEMGANHPGEIKFLCEIALPNYGMITNVGKAHLEGFGSFEGVIQTKTELYRFIQQNNGRLFVNQTNAILQDASNNISKVEYGAKVSGIHIIESFPTLLLAWKKSSVSYNIQTKLSGSYNLENILSAVCIGNYFNVEPHDLIKGLETYTPNNNRSQLLKTSTNTLILDAYNANPSSMHAAISDFASSNYNNKALILGAMKELGQYSKEEHLKLLQLIKHLHFETVFLIGQEFKEAADLCPQCTWLESTDDLLNQLKTMHFTNQTILIKGSRSMHLESVCPLL